MSSCVRRPFQTWKACEDAGDSTSQRSARACGSCGYPSLAQPNALREPENGVGGGVEGNGGSQRENPKKHTVSVARMHVDSRKAPENHQASGACLRKDFGVGRDVRGQEADSKAQEGPREEEPQPATHRSNIDTKLPWL